MLEDAKVWSEIWSNVLMPIAAFAAIWGAKQVTQKVIEARGAGVTAQALAPTGSATGTSTSTSATAAAPQGSAASVPNK